MNRAISILSLCILGAIYMFGCRIYFNPTSSEAKGYYWVYKSSAYKIGDMAVFCIRDKESIKILHQFGLPYIENAKCNFSFLLKKIVAKEGDIIFVSDKGIKINNQLYPNTRAISKYKNIHLNALVIGSKYKLGKYEYFLLGKGNNSYDSRYFGIVKEVDLQYKAILLWQRDLRIW